MAKLVVKGGIPLKGDITVSGYKNSIVVLIAASLLSDEKIKIHNVPEISDVKNLLEFFKSIGSVIRWSKKHSTLEIDNSNISPDVPLDAFPVKMGASNLLFPPLIYRKKRAELPRKMKGCSLGIRELDDRLAVLLKLGAKLDVTEDKLIISIDERFKGGSVWLDYQGVGATENFIMAAVLADGVSTCVNAASEPQVQDLCNFLVSQGAKIEGIGTNKLVIEGVEKLGASEYRVFDDYYEVATFLALGAMTNGDLKVHTQDKENMGIILRNFERLGVKIIDKDDYYHVKPGQKLEVEKPFTANFTPKIEAAPWPYFPADLMPVFVALSTMSEGVTLHWNKVHEGQFLWISELMKFGAQAVLADPHRMLVFGGLPLRATTVQAPFIIRVAVALYMLAASVPGESIVKDADTVLRAHPNFVQNLNMLGSEVRWER